MLKQKINALVARIANQMLTRCKVCSCYVNYDSKIHVKYVASHAELAQYCSDHIEEKYDELQRKVRVAHYCEHNWERFEVVMKMEQEVSASMGRATIGAAVAAQRHAFEPGQISQLSMSPEEYARQRQGFRQWP